MKILLVNDDGYGAEGLMALYDALKDKHEVMIATPETEHSGAGHSVTLRQEIRAKKIGVIPDGTKRLMAMVTESEAEYVPLSENDRENLLKGLAAILKQEEYIIEKKGKKGYC